MSTIQREGLWKMGFGEIGATLKVLEDLGVTAYHLAQLRSDGDLAKMIAETLIEKSIKLHPVDEELATIMNTSRFFGPTNWHRHYGVEFSSEVKLPMELQALKNILEEDCSFEPNKKVGETHFLFFLPGKLRNKNLTIRAWQEIHPKGNQPRFYSYTDAWYRDEDFAKNTTSAGEWHLMYMGVVPESQSKTWEEQAKMIPETHVVPLACEAVPLHFLSFLKTGKYINQGMYGRVRDVDSDGYRVDVGVFDSGGLGVGDCWDGYRDSDLGVFAARKLIIES